MSGGRTRSAAITLLAALTLIRPRPDTHAPPPAGRGARGRGLGFALFKTWFGGFLVTDGAGLVPTQKRAADGRTDDR